ncbi:hypothetical protein, partial [Streptomyces sp. NPDC004726]
MPRGSAPDSYGLRGFVRPRHAGWLGPTESAGLSDAGPSSDAGRSVGTRTGGPDEQWRCRDLAARFA